MAKKDKKPKKTSGIYNNKNGYLSKDELQRFVDEGILEDYLRGFSTLKDRCPPKRMINPTIDCFRCIDCFQDAVQRLKK